MTPGPFFNACDYLLDRHIREGRGDRLALTGVAGDVSYAELAERVAHAARGLRGLGLQAEQRVVMVMADSPEFVVVYLAAMRIGAVPVPISTMLRADGIAEILRRLPGPGRRGERGVPGRGGLPRWASRR